MKKPRQEKWYLGGDGEGPMIWNDRNITLAMSNTTEYAIKKNRKTINEAFRLMVAAPELLDAAEDVWRELEDVIDTADKDDVTCRPGGRTFKAAVRLKEALRRQGRAQPK